MNRFNALSAWFFTMLGVVLFGCSVLVIPERAFAFTLTMTCDDACCLGLCGETGCDFGCSAEMGSCVIECTTCMDGCNSDPSCEDGCMAQATAISCLKTGCETPLGQCTAACNQMSCKDGGLNPKFAKCNSITTGCRCKA